MSELADFWMTREDVAEVCPGCAEKMASLNVRQIKASVFFGVADPSMVVEAARNRDNKTAAWSKLPKGWTNESLKKFWDSMTGDVKKKVTACIKKMEGKVDDPGAFCASARDRVEGKGWRSERDASLAEAAREFEAHVKTANWWNTILIRDEGSTFSIGVMGEDPIGGWSSLKNMMGEVNGRIKKAADGVEKFLKTKGIEVRRSGHPSFGTQGVNNYIGWGMYGRKDADVELMDLLQEGLKAGAFRAYLKEGYTGI